MSVTPGCAWHWMPHWAADQKTLAAHLSFFFCLFLWLPTFLTTHLLYDGHHSHLLLILMSISCSVSFTRSLLLFYFHTESLYGDATDKPLLDCCACGTAKYRVTFFGNWSEKIHPKDYPRKHNYSACSCHLNSCIHFIYFYILLQK